MEQKDYNEIYNQKLDKMKEKLLGSAINDKMKLKEISNAKINAIIAEMEKILPSGKLYWDYQFRTGKLMGILKAIGQNAKIRDRLLEITGLTQDHVDIYYECIGNVPWITKNNTIDPGRPMKFEEAKEFLTLVGLHFGCVVEESDLSDINEERWEAMCKDALEKARETCLNNEKNAGSIPEGGYEE